jgi:hypothetical protein
MFPLLHKSASDASETKGGNPERMDRLSRISAFYNSDRMHLKQNHVSNVMRTCFL